MGRKYLLAVLLMLPVIGCEQGVAPAADFNSPEGAVVVFQNACRAGDFDSAMGCMDFNSAAGAVVDDYNSSNQGRFYPSSVSSFVAQKMEESFRREVSNRHAPAMSGSTSSYPEKESRADGTVVVTELRSHANGGTSVHHYQTCRTYSGWRIAAILD